LPLRIGVLLLLIASLVVPLGSTAAEPRIALLIGNGAYATAPLRNPINDARAMERALKTVGFDVIRLENATKLQMERSIRELSARLKQETISLVYYAGHGIQVNGHNFLIPVDAQIDTEASVRLEAVDVDEILDQMTMAKSRVNIVILDACRNNPFERRFRSVSGGLASIDAPAGTLIAYATAPGQVAADGEGENGLYTSQLVKQIGEPGLNIEVTLKRTRIAVMQLSSGAQIPWESSSLTGDFVFRPLNPAPSASALGGAPAVLPPAASAQAAASESSPSAFEAERVELAIWDAVKNSTDPADFEDYLNRYPRGDFASIAERRLKALQQASAQQAMVTLPRVGAAGDEAVWTSDQKSEVQRALKALGHLQGEPDGDFGSATRAAIKQFQSFEGMPETGFLTDGERKILIEMAQRLAAILDQPASSPGGVSAAQVKGSEQRYAKAWAFDGGKGARRDHPEEAIYWYALAAADGKATALTNLGTLFVRG
jgi:hypothetical protein